MGGGQCAELADRAMAWSGARTFADFANIARGDDYVWGTPVALGEARPGDVVQFRGFAVETETRTPRDEDFSDLDFDHHTAIVEANQGDALLVLEQNAAPGFAVQRRRVPVRSRTYAGNENGIPQPGAVTSVRVSGSISVYRAQAVGSP